MSSFLNQILTVKTTINGEEQDFPVSSAPAAIGTFTFTAERMGTAPTITADLMYPRCLDDEWTKKEYVMFRGEKYFISQVPTSSKSNEDLFYKHSLTLISERIILENTYFLDVVTASTEEQYADRIRSNYTSFSFMGTIAEFASRLSDSMVYSGLCTYDKATKTYTGYHVVIDDDIKNDADIMERIETVSLDTVYLNEALQQINETFELSYYFVGKVCHIGYSENAPTEVLEYGKNKGLLTIGKTNEDYKIIDRITGVGSSDNIPYYYPNASPIGTAIFEVTGIDPTLISIDLSQLKKYVSDWSGYTFKWLYKEFTLWSGCKISTDTSENWDKDVSTGAVSIKALKEEKGAATYYRWTQPYSWLIKYKLYGYKGLQVIITPKFDGLFNDNGFLENDFSLVVYCTVEGTDNGKPYKKQYVVNGQNLYSTRTETGKGGEYWDGIVKLEGEDKAVEVLFTVSCSTSRLASTYWSVPAYNFSFNNKTTISPVLSEDGRRGFSYGDDGFLTYNDSGITIADFSQLDTDNFSLKITGEKLIPFADNLMPSCYRDTDGEQRFYNALNDTYDRATYLPKDGYTTETVSFNNPFIAGNPHEGKENFDDIKPSIENMRNAERGELQDDGTYEYPEGQLYGELADVAFDDNDNDLLGDGEGTTNDIFNGTDEYQHSWFYIKLHKFNGEDISFNLFQHALEGEEAYIEMTSGNCAGCKFQIGVIQKANAEGTGYDFDNPVQVDDNGDIVDGDFGDKVNKNNIQSSQQNTITDEIWIAVKKDNETYGVVIPNQTYNYKPQVGDTFVITGINPPSVLIKAAEKKLDAALVKYMKENNDEKFTFSVTFSRVWLELHPTFTSQLNENARLTVSYNKHEYTLYVSSYSIKADDNLIYEATVELNDTLTISQSGLQKQADAIEANILSAVGTYTHSGDMLASGQKYFLRKDTADTAKGRITFVGGLTANADVIHSAVTRSSSFVDGLTGAGWRIDAAGDAWLDSLSVRGFLEVPELRYNRVEVMLGDEWQAAGGGLIESCTPDYEVTTDTSGDEVISTKDTGTITLHLETGEIGAVAVGDICMGYYHFADSYYGEDTDDGRGNITHAGFTTIYFQITAITDTSGLNTTFRYKLRPSSTYWTANGMHPQPQMNFAAYGNFTNTDRQKSVLRTKTYTRYLAGVNDWEITSGNLMMQMGNLSNLSVLGLTEMTGYSAYLNNIYMTGTIKQLEDLPLCVEVTWSGGESLGSGESATATARLMKGYDDLSSEVVAWQVTRTSSDTAADASWNAAHTYIVTYGELTLTLSTSDLGESGATIFSFTPLGPATGMLILTDESGAILTDESGNLLTITTE